MCGIFGYFHREGRSLDSGVLQAMGHAIVHRGPDDQGVFAAKGAALGNQRLSVIDIQGGHQPFVSDDGRIVVVQNGEIFNHVELAAELAGGPFACRTHSDTEVLLRLYESEGIGFIRRLNGMFAIAIYDAGEQAMYLVRDRIGVKPLYVHDDGVQLTFGSEIKAMLPGLEVRPVLNETALHHYLTFNYVPAPHTIYSGVRHLMPGHLLKITRGGVTTSRWWNLADMVPVHGRDEGEWIEEFNAILDDAVRPLVEDGLRRRRLGLTAGAAEVELAGDPDLLAQLLLTLIENAAQAVGEGGRIEVSLRRADCAVELCVADDGPGVDPAVAGQIFEPFFTTRAEGTGLGLALAARVAQAHGGDLSLRPGAGLGPQGRGACFVLRIAGGAP